MRKGKINLMACLHSHKGEAEVWLQSFATSALAGAVGQHHALAAFTSKKNVVPTVQEDRRALKPVWMGMENLVAIGIQCPDCPVHS